MPGSLCWLPGACSIKTHLAGGSVSPGVFWGVGCLLNSGPRQLPGFPMPETACIIYGALPRERMDPWPLRPALTLLRILKFWLCPVQLSLSTFLLVHTLSHGIRQIYTIPVHAPSQPWHLDITVSFLVSPCPSSPPPLFSSVAVPSSYDLLPAP